MKTWLITGASSGLGRHLAETALERGDSVLATARQPKVLDDLVEQHPGRVVPARLDITQPEEIAAVLKLAETRLGRIDILVNNAGYGLLAALEETDDERLMRILEINLIGPLRLTRGAIPLFRKQGGGHVISISAIAAFSNEVGFGIYGAAKAGLDAASQSLAGELAPFGVKVTVVLPGPFRTDFIARSLEHVSRMAGYEDTVGKFGTLLGRIDGKQTGDPRKAAEAIYQIAGTDKPPFRLVLGKYANDKFARKLTTLGEELEAWKSVGLPTDFGSGPA